LLREGDAVIGDVLKFFPGIESQLLRQLVRDATQEAAQQKSPMASWKLFQYLKSHLPVTE